MTKPDRIIRGYELQEELGRGGFGVVYRANQAILKREVALKVILPQYANDPDFIRRFAREAETVASLEHPFIVPLFDFWRDPDGAYLVMRYVRGGSLRDLLKNNRPDLEQVLQIFDNLGKALHIAHRKGITHRDIKPANILLDEYNNAYVTDFGIAKNPHYDDSKTEDGISGTISYLAPEQLQNGEIGSHTDIYALGVMLYEVLAGQHPMNHMTVGQLLLSILTKPIPDIRDVRPELSDSLNEIIQRATAKNISERYHDLTELLADLRAVQSDATPERRSSTAEVISIELDNPYKGLRAFQEHDSDDFYGRNELTDSLLQRLDHATEGFLAVVGPSGSGKSSVVRAGLLPRLREGAIDGSDKWFIVEMLPGSKPFVELEAALLRIAPTTPDNLLQTLQDENGISRAVKQVLADDTAQLLLVIDQFEEVFTLVKSEETRTRFIANIMDALQDARSQLKIIITIRADFLDRPLHYDNLGQLIRKYTEIVVPLSPTELNNAIRKPAENVGVSYEAGLAERISRDVRDQPGALPLLQYALMELFERRDGLLITSKAYDAIGGVTGSLTKRADEIYRQLSMEGQTTARQLFLRLVTLGEGTEDTRRRVLREEITTLPYVDEVLAAFAQARLLTFDYDPITREPTLEVAHEALIRNWDRLREWLNVARDDLRILGRLRLASNEWLNADREPSYLVSGLRLEEYESWMAQTELELSQQERSYLETSIAEQSAIRQRDEARKAEEVRIARRAANFQRASIGLGVMVVLALIAVGVAFRASNQASNQVATATVAQGIALDSQATARADGIEIAATAQRDRAEGNSILLAANARDLYENGSTTLGLRLAYEANLMPDPPSQSQVVLADLAYDFAPRRAFIGHTSSVYDIAYFANREQIATTSDDGTVILWDVNSGDILRRFEYTAEAWGVAFAPTGEQIVSSYSDGMVILWDVNSGDILRRFEGHSDFVSDIAFTPDGTRIASASYDGTVILWDVNSGDILRRFDHSGSLVEDIEIAPDGEGMISRSVNDREIVLLLWDINSGDMLRRFEGEETAFSALFLPNGQHLIVDIGSELVIWDTVTGDILQRYSEPESSVLLAMTRDGSRVLSFAADLNVLIVWDLESAEVTHRYIEHTASVDALFTSDERHIITASVDQRIFLWDLERGEIVRRDYAEVNELTSDVAYAPDGSQFITTLSGGSGRSLVLLWDAVTGEVVREFEGLTGFIFSAGYSPDGSQILAADSDGVLLLWDVRSGAILRRFEGGHDGFVPGLAFSPDGSRVASAGEDGLVLVWNVNSGELITRFEGHTDTVLAVAFHANNHQIASVSSDTTTLLWDVRSGEIIRRFEGHTTRVSRLALSPDGRQIVSASDDGAILLWDVASGELLQRFDGHRGNLADVLFTPDGSQIISGSSDETIIVWDVRTGTILRRYEDVGQFPSMALVPNSNQFIVVSLDGSMALYRFDSLAQLMTWVQENRYLPELDCTQRRLYDVAPCVDEVLPPTSTLQATETLLPLTMQPTFTPIASPTPMSTIRGNAEIGNNIGEIGIGGSDIWMYDGQAGELITIRLEADNPARLNASQTYDVNGFDTRFIVRAPDGSVIGEFDDIVNGINTNSSAQGLALPQTGIYEIEVRGFDDLSAGAYTLTIERAP